MKIKNTKIKLKTKEYLQFIDITDNIIGLVKKTKIKNGNVVIYSLHTTLAIRIKEKEKGFHRDFKDLMVKLIPKEKYYRHNDLNIRTENIVCSIGATDCLNGHSHCAHLFLGTSETIPIIENKILLGPWQRIFAIELDSAREREIFIQINGI